MKQILLLLAMVFLFSSMSLAQRHDYNWLFGFQYDGEGAWTVDFREDSIYFEHTPRKMEIDNSNAMYSDSMGNLELYTNGCHIADILGDTLLNGDSLNPGTNWAVFCTSNISPSLNNAQYGFFLQNPKKENEVYLIHVYDVNGERRYMYSHCEKNIVNDKWKVVEKNMEFVSDTISNGGVFPTKHANGRDWWLLFQEKFSNRFYSYLFSSEGIEPIDTFRVGEPMASNVIHDWGFSPDGSQLAIYNNKDDLRLFDFDRCSGQLFNPKSLRIDDSMDSTLGFAAGCSWSHDGRYIYLSHQNNVYQVDSWENDLVDGLIEIGSEYNHEPFRTGFGISEVGPDGRIYIKPAWGSSDVVQVVTNPERGGFASNLVKNYFDLPYDIASMPMFPNYRLGPIDGSSCDTLGLDNHPLAGYRYDRLGGLSLDFTEVSWYEPDTWTWDFGDPNSGAANSSSDKYPVHTFSTAGEYEVCLTVSNQYGSDTHCKTIQVWGYVDTEDLVDDSGTFILYPNPTSDVVFWKRNKSAADSPNSSDDLESAADYRAVQVYDATGRLVLSENADNPYLSLQNLPVGLYRLVLRDERGGLLFSGNVSKQ